jgi:hypothetical protein
MTLNDLANLGQVIGAVAVVISPDLRRPPNSAKHKRSAIRWAPSVSL